MAKEKQLKMSNNQDLNLIHENLYQKCNNDWIKTILLLAQFFERNIETDKRLLIVKLILTLSEEDAIECLSAEQKEKHQMCSRQNENVSADVSTNALENEMNTNILVDRSVNVNNESNDMFDDIVPETQPNPNASHDDDDDDDDDDGNQNKLYIDENADNIELHDEIRKTDANQSKMCNEENVDVDKDTDPDAQMVPSSETTMEDDEDREFIHLNPDTEVFNDCPIYESQAIMEIDRSLLIGIDATRNNKSNDSISLSSTVVNESNVRDNTDLEMSVLKWNDTTNVQPSTSQTNSKEGEKIDQGDENNRDAMTPDLDEFMPENDERNNNTVRSSTPQPAMINSAEQEPQSQINRDDIHPDENVAASGEISTVTEKVSKPSSSSEDNSNSSDVFMMATQVLPKERVHLFVPATQAVPLQESNEPQNKPTTHVISPSCDSDDDIFDMATQRFPQPMLIKEEQEKNVDFDAYAPKMPLMKGNESVAQEKTKFKYSKPKTNGASSSLMPKTNGGQSTNPVEEQEQSHYANFNAPTQILQTEATAVPSANFIPPKPKAISKSVIYERLLEPSAPLEEKQGSSTKQNEASTSGAGLIWEMATQRIDMNTIPQAGGESESQEQRGSAPPGQNNSNPITDLTPPDSVVSGITVETIQLAEKPWAEKQKSKITEKCRYLFGDDPAEETAVASTNNAENESPEKLANELPLKKRRLHHSTPTSQEQQTITDPKEVKAKARVKRNIDSKTTVQSENSESEVARVSHRRKSVRFEGTDNVSSSTRSSSRETRKRSGDSEQKSKKTQSHTSAQMSKSSRVEALNEQNDHGQQSKENSSQKPYRIMMTRRASVAAEREAIETKDVTEKRKRALSDHPTVVATRRENKSSLNQKTTENEEASSQSKGTISERPARVTRRRNTTATLTASQEDISSTTDQQKVESTKRKRSHRVENSKEKRQDRKEVTTQNNSVENESNISTTSSTRSSRSHSSFSFDLGPLPAQIMFSKIEASNYRTEVEKLGGIVCEMPHKASILIVDRVCRTYKFLCAMGKGIPVVSAQWLYKSIKKRTFVDPSPYIVVDKDAEKKYEFNLKRDLAKARSKPLLRNYILFTTPSVSPPPSELSDIIKCNGGFYAPKISSVDSTDGKEIVLISTPDDKDYWKKYIKAFPNAEIINPEGLMQSIMKQRIDFSGFRLKK